MTPSAAELLQDPDLHRQVRRITLAARKRLTGRLVGAYRSAFRGAGLEVQSLRPYAYGDDVRAIDWTITARTGHLHVRQFREERELNLMLVLDTSASMALGKGTHHKLRVGFELATLLGLAAQLNNDNVGLMSFADGVQFFAPPARGRTHLQAVLFESLRRAQPGRQTHMEAALQYLEARLRQASIVVVISDFLETGFAQPLRRLARRHNLLLLRLLHPAEVLPGQAGVLPLRHAETGRTHWHWAGWNRRPQTGPLHGVHRQLQDLSQSLGLGYVSLNVTHDYLPPLERYFRSVAR